MAISYKTKQFSLVLIKIGLVVATFYFIYNKLVYNIDLRFFEFAQNLLNNGSVTAYSILILLLLSIFNWFFEILKWQTLVNEITIISFNEAAAQSLGTLTASLLTPNRIGDYSAKAMNYQPNLRKRILLLNLVGNSVQMAITTIFGISGFVYFAQRFQPELNYNALLIWFGMIGITILFIIRILKMNWLRKQQKSIYKILAFVKNIPKSTLFKTMLFSGVRYVIFSLQFYFLFHIFGVEMGYFEAMSAISSMYLLSSIIPSIFIFDVIIKGGVAIYVFGLIGISEAIIVSIITLMWILNFVLPSVIGSYHVLTFKLPKNVT